MQVGLGYDSHAYWLAVQDMDHLYSTPALSRDAFLYSPLFAQAVWPLGRLPWPLYAVVWAVLQASAFGWLLRPLPGRWLAPALVATIPEILTGNINALMATALVLGASRGYPWVLLTLTKVTPGLVGLTWLAAGRRWHALLGVAVTGGLGTSLSFVAAPTAWRDWVHFLGAASPASLGDSAVWLSLGLLLLALAIAAFAGLTGRPWLLPLATILVSPTLGPNTLTLFASAPRLSRTTQRTRRRPALRRTP